MIIDSIMIIVFIFNQNCLQKRPFLTYIKYKL